MPGPAPDPIIALAQARADARSRRDWAEADRLRGEIEAAGWRVVDEGLSFTLAPARPADVVVDGRLRYGHPSSVPSRLEEPVAGFATVVLVAGEDPDEVVRLVTATHAHAPGATALVVVGDAPSLLVEAALEAIEARLAEDPGKPVEIVLTSERLGHAAAADAGIRRAAAAVVVLLGPGVEPAGDIVAPLVRALDDPAVAIAGSSGVDVADLRHSKASGSRDAGAVGPGCLAFRRADYVARGPLDERLRTDQYLALWWSLVLRDEGVERQPRRALVVDGLPLVVRRDDGAGPGDGSQPPVAGARDRAARRDYYRVLERFGGRSDLLGSATAVAQAGGHGAAGGSPGGR